MHALGLDMAFGEHEHEHAWGRGPWVHVPMVHDPISHERMGLDIEACMHDVWISRWSDLYFL